MKWLTEILPQLWAARKNIATVVFGVTVLAVIVSLLLPKYYKSTAVLLPQNEENSLSALAGLSGLAALAGATVGQVPMEQMYPDILRSETILHQVIYSKYRTEEFSEPVDLIRYWKYHESTEGKNYEQALLRLQSDLDITVDRKTSIVTVALLMKEPQLAADVINCLISQLDQFLRTKRITYASEQRKWIDSRLVQVESDLRESEDALKNFREKNRNLGSSPQLLLDESRLSRQVEINSMLFLELKKQFEVARIEEIKNIPVINVLDMAKPAATKDRPRRTLIVAVSFLLSLIGVGAVVLYRAEIDNFVKQITSIIGRKRANGRLAGPVMRS